MGHTLTAALGSFDVLNALSSQESLHSPVEAKGGVWVLALNERALDSVTGFPVGEPPAGFTCLFPKLLEKLCQASVGGWVVYLETDYFGGVGEQGAVAFRNGSVLYGPSRGRVGPINAALASVGFKRVPPAADEFETIGLHLVRNTSDWLPYGEGDDNASEEQL